MDRPRLILAHNCAERVVNWFANCVVGTLHLLVRPKISESTAIELARGAASAKGWRLGPVMLDREMDFYIGPGAINGSEIMVVITVNGRSGDVQIERADELADTDE